MAYLLAEGDEARANQSMAEHVNKFPFWQYDNAIQFIKFGGME